MTHFRFSRIPPTRLPRRSFMIAAGGLATMLAFGRGAKAMEVREKPKATLYRNPNCSCCLDYAAYLRGAGFDVTVDSNQNLAAVRKQLHVPEKFAGCHVTVIGRYAVEGHVSASSINKLLAERPDIVGISIPGMPPGTPGMTGVKTRPIPVFEIENGTVPAKIFATD